MVYTVGWLGRQRLRGAVAWDYLRPVRRLAKGYSWAIGWPLIVRGFDYTMKGLGKAIDGVEWTAHAGVEVAKGTFAMTAKPISRTAWSRLVAIKRLALWDVPLAAASAVIRTPIAIAKSPLEMVRGVRDAIFGNKEEGTKSLVGNTKDILNSISQFKFLDALSSTRKAITDVILPPFARPLKQIFAPSYNLVNTAVGAELQTVSAIRKGITDDIPGGYRRIVNSGSVASAKMAEVHARRAAIRAAYEKEEEERKAALKAQVAEARGEGGGAAKGGGMG